MPIANLSRSYAQAAFKLQLIDLANKIRPTLTGDFRQVQQLVDGVQMAFAVWQDPTAPDGVGFMAVKGVQHMREVIASNRSKALSMTAIPCVCAEQAEALRLVIADPDRRH